MKTFIKVLCILVFAGIVETGCESLTDVQFSTGLVTDLKLVVPPQPVYRSGLTVNAFSDTAIVDPLSDAEIARYMDKVNDLKIKKITAEVTSISKPVTILSSTLAVSSEGYEGSAWTFTNEQVQLGTVLTLGNENGQITNAQAILKDMKPMTVIISGITDQDDVRFTLRIKVEVEVTASPLD